MTDILYILGNGAAKIDNWPLRWSLRSIEKNTVNYGRIIVCGEIPSWLSDDVVKVPYENTKSGKEWNILYAIQEAVTAADLDAPFLLSSDDHYFLPAYNGDTPGKHDLDSWPRYCHAGRLPTMADYINTNKIPDSYKLQLIKTRGVLGKERLSIRRACLHLDTWTDPQDVSAAVAFAEKWEGLTRAGLEHTCLINAMLEARKHAAGETVEFVPYAHDRKVQKASDIQKKIADRLPAFTTSPKAEERDDVVMFMTDYYSTPSHWENPE